MSEHEQANSDPLPYTQVDRAVKPKATLLAAMMKSTTQHALGSLVEFWDLNGDPREIETLVLAGKRTVVLNRDEVRRRFRLASGHDIDPDDLRSLGLLEAIDGNFRVRGMSRYFAPVERRLQARLAASMGGKASAEARKTATGTAQPRSSVGSGAVREPLKRTPKRPRSEPRSDAEAAPEAAPKREATQRSAVSGQLQLHGELLPPSAAKVGDPKFIPLRDELCRVFRQKRGHEYPYKFGGIDDARVRDLLKLAIEPTIVAAWHRALDATHPTTSTLDEFHHRFPKYVAPEPDGRPAAGQARAGLEGSGPLTATEGAV